MSCHTMHVSDLKVSDAQVFQSTATVLIRNAGAAETDREIGHTTKQ